MGGLFGGFGNGCGKNMGCGDMDICSLLLLLYIINSCGCNDCTILILLLLMCNCNNDYGHGGCHN